MIAVLRKDQRLSPLYTLYDEFRALRKAGLYETAVYKFPMCYHDKRKTVLWYNIRGESW